VTLFLGGPSGPNLGFLAADGWVNTWIMPVVWFLLKLLVLVYGTFWIRASVPRLRYDQLMALGWKYLIEIAILWFVVSATYIVGRDLGWPLWAYFAAPAAAIAAYGVLWLAMPKSGERVEEFR
jgi:NADH-quinone oxidoreductase subunit H